MDVLGLRCPAPDARQLLGLERGDGPTPTRQPLRSVLVANMGNPAEKTDTAISSGALDAMDTRASLPAKPVPPEHLHHRAPLNAPDPASFCSPGPAGSTDNSSPKGRP